MAKKQSKVSMRDSVKGPGPWKSVIEYDLSNPPTAGQLRAITYGSKDKGYNSYEAIKLALKSDADKPLNFERAGRVVAWIKKARKKS